MLSFNVAKKNKTKKTGSFTSQQLKLYSLRRSNDSAARRKTEDLLFLKRRKGRKKKQHQILQEEAKDDHDYCHHLPNDIHHTP